MIKKISITGATGFVGKHLVNELVKNPNNLEIKLLSRKKLTIKDNKTKFINFNLDKKYQNYFKKIGSPDKLIHLAWGGIPHYTSDYHVKSELNKQYYFISKCIEGGLKNLLVTGTCLEYGNHNSILKESMMPNPKISYAIAKYKLYKKIMKLKRKYNFNLTWVRIFFLYGLDVTHKTIYSELIDAINNKEQFFNMSPGDQIRDYLSIDELSQKLIPIIKDESNIGIINVCSGKKKKLKNIVSSWIKEKKSQIKLNLCYYDYQHYEPKIIYGSVRKLNKYLKKNDYI